MISVIVLTKNEEKNIVDCLESLKWCDEIIVIDDNSSDLTVNLAKKLGAKVFTNLLANDFSMQRNFGLSKTKNEWVLFVDADERVNKELKNEIVYLISQSDRVNKLNGYFIKRIDFMWRKELKYGETGNIKLLRLAKRGIGKWEGKVHERWKVKGSIGELKNPLVHYPHKTINNFLKEINFYSDLRANELDKHAVREHWISIILYPLGKFLLNYLIKKGFLDGVHGLIIAIIMSFHSFLVRGKLWFLSSRHE